MARLHHLSFLAAATGLALAGCASGASSGVSADTPRADLILRATGAGDWSVRCEAETAQGRPAIAEMDGRGTTDSDVIVINDVVSGSCSHAAAEAPLTLTLEAGMACPFGDGGDGLCRTILAAGDQGSFDLTPQ